MARTRRKTSYHHGDLRRALLEASLPLLRKGGPDALTLRAVARAAGVSQTAPYRHFADRDALVAAVADEGFRRLHGRLMDAAQAPAKRLGKAPTTQRGGLQALAIAYVEFAVDHPDEYRVMFGGKSPHASDTEGGGARQTVFNFLRGGIVMLQQQQLVREGDAQALTLTAWALVHGLAMLTIDGQIGGTDRGVVKQLTLSATELLMFGMATPQR